MLYMYVAACQCLSENGTPQLKKKVMYTGKSKSGAVVKHQRVFVVLRDHISCKTDF